MLHKVIVRTDVHLGPDPDGGEMWAQSDVNIAMHDDHFVDVILANFGEEREDVPVQVLVSPRSEGVMDVIEIHYTE